MDEDDTTTPVVDEAAPSPDSDATQEVEAQELDEFGNPLEEPAEEDEEIELGKDLKLKVPKTHAEELRRGFLREADYTQKTQTLAQERQAFHAERNALMQADADELLAHANLVNIRGQLQQYESIDWNAAYDNARAIDAQNFDGAEQAKVDAAWRQFQMLQSQERKTGGLLAAKLQERQSRQAAMSAQERALRDTLFDQGTPELKKAIPDWSRAKAATLEQAMISHYGFSREDMDAIEVDPRLYMVMYDAAQWRETQAKTKKAQTIQQQQQVQPAAKATRSSAPPQGLDDRISAEEWVRRRNAQVRKRAQA
jgi:hypothetical protein